jgi:hypothetical protein
MKDLEEALEILQKYKDMPHEEFVSKMVTYYNLQICDQDFDDWKFTGLGNIDFFKCFKP